MASIPARLAAAAAGLVVLALSGCHAKVQTSVHVTGPTTADITVAAVFSDEAAAAITGHPDTRAQLEKVFTDRTGTAPQYTTSGGTVTVSEKLTYQQLTAAKSLTGVSAAALSGSGDHVQVSLTLAAPTAVADAVRAATKAQPDAAALAATMLEQTDVVITVSFDGGISSVTGPHDGDGHGHSVSYTRRADSTQDGTLVVVGNPHASHTGVYAAIVATFAVLAGAAFWYTRRRR